MRCLVVAVQVILGAVLNATLLTSTSLGASPVKAVFGAGRNWVLVDLRSYSPETITFPLSRVDAVTVSISGDEFAIIGQQEGTYGVWLWKRSGSAPRLLTSGVAHYGDPAFGPDGWIYFSHSNGAGRRHTFGTYAQLFRVRTDGTKLEQVTDENGCHYGVTFRAGRLVYIHTSCNAQSWVKRQAPGASAVPRVLAETLGSISEIAVSPQGRSTVYVSDQPDSYVLMQVETGRPPRQRLILRRSMDRVRPTYGRSSEELLYQHEGKVWVLSKGRSRVIAVLDKPGGAL